MKRILPTLLGVIVVFGLFAAVGYTGYRFGYTQGVQAGADGGNIYPWPRPFDDIAPRGMPMHRFGFERGWDRGGYPMMGFGFFSPWIWLWRVALLALIIWFVWWLFSRSGWRLTRQTTVPDPPKTKNE